MSDQIPTLGNPFDLSQPGGNQPGLAGQTPDFWRSLALFGGNLAAGANARTAGGFLANGPGLGGAVGAAIGPTMAQTTQAAALRSQLAGQGADTIGKQIANFGAASQLPLTLARNQWLTRAYTDPQFMQSIMSQFSGGVAAPSSSAAPTSSDPAGGPSGYAKAIGGIEGTGANPRSTANGTGQFTDGTWGQFAQENPSLFQGMTPQQVMASRTDPVLGPQLGAKATDWLATKNAAPLQAAGVQANGATLGMAHFLGPQGAAAIVKAPDDALAGGILGQALGPDVGGRYIQANPTLATTTAGQLKSRYANVPDPTFVGGPQQPAAGTAQAGGVPPVSSADAAAKVQFYENQGKLGRFLQSMGLPAPIDPAESDRAADQWRAVTTAGPAESAKAAVGLAYAGPTAAAKAQNENIDARPGAIIRTIGPDGRQMWIKNPQVEIVQDATGAEHPVHVTPPMPGSPPGTQGESTAIAGPNGQPLTTKLAPQQIEFQEQRGKDLAEQFTKIDNDAAAAKDSNYLFDNMRNDAQSWDMGKFATFEGDARAYLSAVSHTFGVTSPDIDKPLADYQAFNKSSGMLLRAAVHDTSSRAAVQEYKLIGDSLPQPTTSAQGFGQVADQWQGLNDFRLAKQKFAQDYQGNPQQFNIDFNSKVSPTSFMFNRMSQTPQGQQDMQALLANMQKTPEGRMAAGRILSQYRYSKQAGLFDDLPPIGSDATNQQAPPSPIQPAAVQQ